MIEYYLVDGWSKRWIEDDFKKGEVGESCSFDSNDQFKSSTLKGVIQELLDFTGGCWLDIYLPYEGDDQAGHVLQISVLENRDGCRACESERKDWKRGLKKLYNAEYTFTVEHIRSEKAYVSTDMLAKWSNEEGKKR